RALAQDRRPFRRGRRSLGEPSERVARLVPLLRRALGRVQRRQLDVRHATSMARIARGVVIKWGPVPDSPDPTVADGQLVDDASDTASPDPKGVADTPLPAGAVLGRYILISLLGRGGMSLVYLAYDP